MRRFITDASHELRTPLTTIRGFAELYRQGAARDVEMLMSRIESESRRMGLLVEDLLLLAQLDAQRPLEQHRVDLLILATDAVHDAQSIADEARLRQVLGNLVANALQHTPETAGVTVRIGTTATEAVLEVVDEGPGMRADDANRVFERFYRTDSSRTRTSGGTGLGLSIVDSLVHAHGGRGTGATEPGRGPAPLRRRGGGCRGSVQSSSASAAMIFACASSSDSGDGLRSTPAKPKSVRL